MAKMRLKFYDLRRILRSYGVTEAKNRGKGSHTLFEKQLSDGKYSYPIPNDTDVNPAYVKGARKKFRLLPSDGVTDPEFFSK